jgi:hypothetical protein
MTEKRIIEIKKLLSPKKSSKLNRLFYERNNNPIIKLYSKIDILEELKINDNLNSLEYEGVIRILSVSLAMIRKRAKERLQPFVDYEVNSTKNHNISLHGFTDDIAKLEKNIEKYKEYIEQRKQISKQTEKACKSSITLLK